MAEHTEVPWTYDGNCGGYIEQAGDRIARAYSNDDAAYIVQAVNSHEFLVAKLEKVFAWLNRLADRSEQQAKDSVRFPSFAEACTTDAKNYRRTATDIRQAIDLARQSASAS